MPNDLSTASRSGLASDFDALHDENELPHPEWHGHSSLPVKGAWPVTCPCGQKAKSGKRKCRACGAADSAKNRKMFAEVAGAIALVVLAYLAFLWFTPLLVNTVNYIEGRP